MPAYNWQTDPFGYMGDNSPNFIAAGQPEYARGDLNSEARRIQQGEAPTYNPILTQGFNTIPAYDINKGQSYGEFLAKETARTQAGADSGPYTNNPTLNWNFLNQNSNAIPTGPFRLPTYQDPQGVNYAIRAGTTALPSWAVNATPNWQQLIGGGAAGWGNPGAPTFAAGQNIFQAPPVADVGQEVNPNPVPEQINRGGGSEEFDFPYKSIGLDTAPVDIGNIFQTATGSFGGNPTGYTGVEPRQEPVQVQTGPAGGTMFGVGPNTGPNEGFAGLPVGSDYINPGMVNQPGATGSNVPPGVTPNQGPVVEYPGMTVSGSRPINWGSVGASALSFGVPGALFNLGRQIFSTPVQTPGTSTATVLPPVEVPRGPYEEPQVPGVNTNFVPPGGYGAINTSTPGITLNAPGYTGIVQYPQYRVNESTVGDTTAAPLNPYYRYINPNAVPVPPYTVAEPRVPQPTGTAPSTAIEVPGRTLTVPGQTNISQVYGPTYNAPTTTGPSTTVSTTAGSTITTGGTGGGGTGGGTGGYTAPATVAGGRNVLSEGQQTLNAYNQLMPGLLDLYRNAAGGYSSADAARLAQLTGAGGDYAATQANLNALAAQQTTEANRLLREGNLADAQRLATQAEALKRQANPELYAGLEQFQGAAGGQVAADLAKLQQAQARQLSPEDLRNAQQAAREAYAARGLVMGPGAIGAEILNRQNLATQREQEARANLAQSMGQLYQGIGARTANVFDPLAATLSQQYGMQTQNIGNTGQLFGQAGNLAGGAYTNQMAANVFNPWSPYAQDVYGTNFNAAVAQQIAAANNAAAIEAARQGASATTSAANTALLSKLIGGGLGAFIGGGLGG